MNVQVKKLKPIDPHYDVIIRRRTEDGNQEVLINMLDLPEREFRIVLINMLGDKGIIAPGDLNIENKP